MQPIIENGIAIPANAKGKGVNKYAVKVQELAPTLALLTTVGQSFFIPCVSYTAAQTERRYVLWLVNKYGRKVGNRYITHAVDGQPAILAVEAHTDENGKEFPAIAAKDVISAGVRVWLQLTGLEKIADVLSDSEKPAFVGTVLENVPEVVAPTEETK